MKRFSLGIGLGLFVAIAVLRLTLPATISVAQTAAVPIVVFENDQIKAMSLTLEPGQATPEHTHQVDEIVVCLESSRIRITKAGPDPEGEAVQPKAGSVFMPAVKGVTHILTNVGETRYKQISIELK
jgi:predicted metal-dependent enzyme (double-stranded beta helix superfamily)